MEEECGLAYRCMTEAASAGTGCAPRLSHHTDGARALLLERMGGLRHCTRAVENKGGCRENVCIS